MATATGTERAALTAELDEIRSAVRAEKLGEVAAEFDRVHNIQRAVEVGSVDAVIRAAELRPASSRRSSPDCGDAGRRGPVGPAGRLTRRGDRLTGRPTRRGDGR